jgi:hypothetical protein
VGKEIARLVEKQIRERAMCTDIVIPPEIEDPEGFVGHHQVRVVCEPAPVKPDRASGTGLAIPWVFK